MFKVMIKKRNHIELFATTDDQTKARNYAQTANADSAWIVDGDYRTIFSTSNVVHSN